MIALMSPVLAFCVIVALAAAAWRLASERDRLPELWTALAVAAAGAAVYGCWRWLARAQTDAGVVAAGFAIWIAPPIAAGAVVFVLYWMRPGRPRIGASVAVRVMDGDPAGGGRE